jgi:hypothetical protein
VTTTMMMTVMTTTRKRRTTSSSCYYSFLFPFWCLDAKGGEVAILSHFLSLVQVSGL